MRRRREGPRDGAGSRGSRRSRASPDPGAPWAFAPEPGARGDPGPAPPKMQIEDPPPAGPSGPRPEGPGAPRLPPEEPGIARAPRTGGLESRAPRARGMRDSVPSLNTSPEEGGRGRAPRGVAQGNTRRGLLLEDDRTRRRRGARGSWPCLLRAPGLRVGDARPPGGDTRSPGAAPPADAPAQRWRGVRVPRPAERKPPSPPSPGGARVDFNLLLHPERREEKFPAPRGHLVTDL